jgi:hypothetical protein
MRRLVGCLVVGLLASTAAWVGCRDDFEDLSPAYAIGSGTDSGMGGDAYGGGAPGSDAMVIVVDASVALDSPVEGPPPDAGSGSGIDAGSGSGIDAGSGSGIDAGSGSGIDAGVDAAIDAGSDPGSGGSDDDAGGNAGNPPGTHRGPEDDGGNRTSFYACTGGPASAGLEVGAPIALALAIAVRRRRRHRYPPRTTGGGSL